MKITEFKKGDFIKTLDSDLAGCKIKFIKIKNNKIHCYIFGKKYNKKEKYLLSLPALEDGWEYYHKCGGQNQNCECCQNFIPKTQEENLKIDGFLYFCNRQIPFYLQFKPTPTPTPELINGKIYISGPMDGIESNNKSRFVIAYEHLKTKYKEVTNPHNIYPDNWSDCEYINYIIADLLILTTCQAIYMLEGWEHSAGAIIEHKSAQKLGLKIYYEVEPKLIIEFNIGDVVYHKSNDNIKMVVVDKCVDNKYTCRCIINNEFKIYTFYAFELTKHVCKCNLNEYDFNTNNQ